MLLSFHKTHCFYLFLRVAERNVSYKKGLITEINPTAFPAGIVETNQIDLYIEIIYIGFSIRRQM